MPRVRGPLLWHVDEVGLPAVILVQRSRCSVRCRACQHGGVQRIIRARVSRLSPGFSSALRQMSTVPLTPEVTNTSCTLVMPCARLQPRIASIASLMPGRRRVSVLPVLHRPCRRLQSGEWASEVEVDGIADIQQAESCGPSWRLHRPHSEITNGVADVLPETLSSGNFADLSGWHFNSGNSTSCFVQRDRKLNRKAR